MDMACNCERKKKLLTKMDKQTSSETVYMDYNATTPVLKETIAAFEKSCRNDWANPSSYHTAGVLAWQSLENCRTNISKYFNRNPEHFYFSSSGSESIYAGIRGLYSSYKDSFFLTTAIEHSSVLKNITDLPRHRYKILKVTDEGRIDLSTLSSVIAENRGKKIICIYSPVNHETDGIQPIKEIYNRVNAANGIVFTDSVQAVPRLPVEEWIDYCDMFAMSSHKIYAPKGSGLLYKPESVSMDISRSGGGQESGYFPGTENTAGIAAMSEAFSILKKNSHEEFKRLKTLSSEGLAILKNLPYKIILESPVIRVPGVLCFSFPEIYDIEDFLTFLIYNNICISRFSACADNIKGKSQVLTAMGRSEERASKSIRLSLGLFSKREDFYRLSEGIKHYFEKRNLKTSSKAS
jgi:cysteine desulfurase